MWGIIVLGTAWWYHRQSIAWREQSDLHFTNAVYVNDWIHAEQLANSNNNEVTTNNASSPTQSRIVPSISPFRSDDGLAGPSFDSFTSNATSSSVGGGRSKDEVL